MTSSSSNPQKGDRIAPPLRQKSQTLLNAAELADRKTAELDAPSKAPSSKWTNLAQALKAVSAGAPSISCRQNLWISIFFDGTGNNMDADTPTNEHSNIVRLYLATPTDDQVKGRYRIYVPGIGTYFREIGDPGNTDRGKGFGAMGQARLDWATATLEKRLAPHLARANNPSNAIDEINIAVFGFSRGATEARAFVRDFVKNKCLQQNNQLKLKNGGWRVRIRFMGLFDTVASVGLPMSANNLSSVRINRVTAANVLRVRVAPFNPWLRAVDLAFGEPGADPSPGDADGHASWADDLRIPTAVEQCVHFVAAHEIRNSFPVDSIFYKGERPANCREMIYPGVHSDVGGGYRPGEEGKSGTPKLRTAGSESSRQMLSQFPLCGMYVLAMAAGVPLLAQTAWKNENKRDFELDSDFVQFISHYMNAAGWGGVPMGVQLNKHMALYYAWRFAKIRRNQSGDRSEELRIAGNEKLFQSESEALKRQVAALQDIYYQENAKVSQAEQQYQNYRLSGSSSTSDARQSEYLEKLNQAKNSRALAQNAYLSAKAQLDTMPSIGRLSKNMAELDKQLMSDAQDIYQVCQSNPEKRKKLRPHYKVLLDAYENEFVRNHGLKDEKIYLFFELYVHESLADFYKDSTLPSDPRVVYFGGDEKYKYAVNSPINRSDEAAA